MKPHEIDALRLAIERLIRDNPEMADDEWLRADMLSAETNIDEVLTHLIRISEDVRAFRDGTKEQIERLNARRQRFDRQLGAARDLMMALLNAADLKKKVLPEATIFLRHNPPHVIGDPDPDALPDDVVKVERKVSREKLRDAMIGGRSFEGLALSNSPPSVVVSVR